MEDQRGQFTFYSSIFESAKRIRNKAARADFYDAVCAYALNGVMPDLDKLTDAAAIGFISAKPNLDTSRKKAKSGKAGGSAKQGESKPEANGKQNASKPEANPKQGESEKEEEKEKEKEIEIEIEKENECYIMAQTVVCLPLNDGKEYQVTVDMVSEFSTLYPAVDVTQELRNMRGWLLSNPRNRKTASGIQRFINTWLSKEQNRARPQNGTRSGNTIYGSGKLGAAELAAIKRVMREPIPRELDSEERAAIDRLLKEDVEGESNGTP